MHLESYVSFDQTDVAAWEIGKPAPLDEPGIVEVWRLYFPSFINQVAQLYDTLHPAEKSKSALFHHEKDKLKFIIGKAMLRMLLADYLCTNPKSLDFTFGMHMKPVLKVDGKVPLHFNVSHSGDYILIAVADHPVGIDVERYETGLNIKEIMEIAFSEQEITFMNTHSIPQQAFFQLWTRKEALLKATSKGLNNDIRYVPCLNGKHRVPAALLHNSQEWRVSNFPIDKQHIGSIAYSGNTREVRFKQFTTQRTQVLC